MRFLILPVIVFILVFFVLHFFKELHLNKGKTWMTIGKQFFIALASSVITGVISAFIVFLN